MIRYRCNPPALVKTIFNDFKWNSSADKILLTFDDGPLSGNTETVLKILNNYNVKAAFFCVGNNIRQNPGLTAELLAEGHLIGNHTFNHKKITELPGSELLEEITGFNKLLEDKHAYKVKFFRPPHGKFNLKLNKVLKDKEMINVMWSLLTYDFKCDLNIFKDIVDNYLVKNSIVVLHDSIKSKPIIHEAVEYLLEKIHERGLAAGEPAECLK